MIDEMIEVSDENVRAYIRKHGGWDSSGGGWGPVRTLSWDQAKRELIALRRGTMERRKKPKESHGGWGPSPSEIEMLRAKRNLDKFLSQNP